MVVFALAYVVFLAIALYVAYWVLRLGVRHGIQDVERGRSRHAGASPTQLELP